MVLSNYPLLGNSCSIELHDTILFIILRNGLLYTRQKATNPRSALALFAKPADNRGVK